MFVADLFSAAAGPLDPGLLEAGGESYQVFEDMVAATLGDVGDKAVKAATITYMSSTYGFALLRINDRLKPFMYGDLRPDDLVEALLSVKVTVLPGRARQEAARHALARKVASSPGLTGRSSNHRKPKWGTTSPKWQRRWLLDARFRGHDGGSVLRPTEQASGADDELGGPGNSSTCTADDKQLRALSLDLVRLLRVRARLAVLFLDFGGVIFAADVGEVDVRRRQLQAHVVHGVGDDLRHREVAEPLVV